MKPISRGSKAGFTLVELIVVIAILAILAGVAIPVYSGYIEKANQAADLQLLGAVNTSFAASCAEVGISSSDVSGAVLKVTDGCITGVNVSGLKPGVTPMFITASIAPTNGVVALSARPSQPFVTLLSATDAKTVISESFLKYFAGNTTTELKYYEGAGNFAFNPTTGTFEAFDNGADRTLSYVDANGQTRTLSINTNVLNKYLGSSFDEMGAEELSGKIDALTASAIKAITEENAGKSLFSSPAFQSFLENKGITLDPGDADYATKAANALVLYTASLNNGIDVDQWISALRDGTEPPLDGTTAPLIIGTTTKYALLAAYCGQDGAMITPTTSSVGAVTALKGSGAYSKADAELEVEKIIAQMQQENPDANYSYEVIQGKKGWQYQITTTTSGSPISANEWFSSQNINNMFDIVGIHSGGEADRDGMWDTFMQSAEFQNYLNSSAEKDLAAFKSALSMVDANTANVNINAVLQNGWTEGGIAELIYQITGN